MRQYLPINNFKWFKNLDKIEQNLMKIKNIGSARCVLKVDWEKTQELHDIHKDYLLASEKINIPKQWLPNYCLKFTWVHNIITRTVKNLVPNLMNKNNCLLEYRNLKQCLELAIKWKKTRRILKFKQIDWMSLYIDFNRQKRTISNNEADKSFFKLTNNSVHGKAKENLRKIIKIRVAKNIQDFIKYTLRPTYMLIGKYLKII